MSVLFFYNFFFLFPIKIEKIPNVELYILTFILRKVISDVIFNRYM